jgi:hypothetical protein
MYAMRRWSVRHARGLNTFYRGFEADASGVLRGRTPWYPQRNPDPNSNRTLS